MINETNPKDFHFSGHDTFHLRYSWLPKAADYINKNKKVTLSDPEKLMVELGIGKNMARSLRHWSESSQLFVKNPDQTHSFTKLGSLIFAQGYDPYLELPDTNWLIHYLIVSNHKKNALWFYLFNIFNESIIIKNEFLFSATNWFKDKGINVNPRSLEKDFQCCMNMYDSKNFNTVKGRENILSSPFRELRLIKKIGEYYRLRTINSMEISPAMMSFCLLDYFENEGFQNFTPLSDILNGLKSPGRVFRLTENCLLEYLNEFKKYTNGYLFDNTSGMQQVIKKSNNTLDKYKILKKVYVNR